MDGFQVFLAIGLMAGGIIMFVSAFRFNGGKREEPGGDIETRLNRYNERLSEADNAINELDSLSRDVFAQFDDKYKELLFLYNMIDEKKTQPLAATAPKAPVEAAQRQKPRGYNNEKFGRVIALRDSGLDAEAIAKELSIGKGEVSLILELSKR